MAFISEDFLLHNQTARYLYRKYAAEQPILDYHCHLSARELAEDRRFGNLFEIWLEGDHYKWRAMRANGVPERYCTGDADPFQKFTAWAGTVPHTVRNPLYHWTHLELKRYFDIEELLDQGTAASIWKAANERLKEDGLTARRILERFQVTALCTTDDPADSLKFHEQLHAGGCATRILPTFRPDRALRTADPRSFNRWVNQLGEAASLEISTLADLLAALRRRHDYFHQHGCRLSDHGLNHCHSEPCTETEASAAFALLRSGRPISPEAAEKFAGYMMLFFGELDAEKGWTKQLHLGAYRNANARMLNGHGRDTGFDSIGDWPHVRSLGRYLDSLDALGKLPKTIVYNANPADNYVFAAMTGNFQDGKAAGKIQFGSAWWFLDQKDGIELQLNALSNCGLLSRFVGMVTDSRSFMSFVRHEYFRRVLCNLIGDEVEKGELPEHEELIGGMIARICYGNAVDYLCLPLGSRPAAAANTNGHGGRAHGAESFPGPRTEKGY